MKISFVKCNNDENVYKIPEVLGIHVSQINKPEEVDFEIEKLKREKYTTIIIPNELASFSQNIIKKYKCDRNVKIIIVPNKKQ